MSTRDPLPGPGDVAGPGPGDLWTTAFEAMAQDPALIARLAGEVMGTLGGPARGDASPFATGSAPGAAAVPPAVPVYPHAPAPQLTNLPEPPEPPTPTSPVDPAVVLSSPAVPPAAAFGVPGERELRQGPAAVSRATGGSPLAAQPGSALPYFLEGLPADRPELPIRFEAAPFASPFAAPALPALGLAPRPFDPHLVRRDFPVLQQHVNGRPLVWLDNAATTQKPNAVIDRLASFYRHEYSNIHRGAHTLAARATDAYEGAREAVRRFLNAPSAREIIFVRGTTEGVNLVAQTFGRRHVGEGDEIVVTHLEHHANIVPWQLLCAERGAKLRVAPVDDTGQIVLEAYERLLGPRTRLVALSQVSNALGTVTPASEMVELAHRHGARVLVDGAQAVSHFRVDVRALDADFYVFSGHKVFAPTGIGVVYGKPDVLESLPPWQGGGNMIADVTFEKTVYNPPPARFEAGTPSIADAVGLEAALDYVESIGLEAAAAYEHALLEYAAAGLATIPGLRPIGTAREKAGVLSFVLDGLRAEDVGQALDREGIAVRSGHHCAQPILRRFGVEATVRPSLAFYNTCEDVDALVAALRRITAGRGHAGL